MTPIQTRIARELWNQHNGYTVSLIAKTLGVDRYDVRECLRSAGFVVR